MRARVPAAKRPSSRPLVPVPQPLRVRSTQGTEVRHLLRLPHREWGFEQQLARRPDTAQARLHPALGAGPPENRQRKLRLRARLGHGEDARPVSRAGRECASSQRRQRRQPAGEPRAVDTPSADRGSAPATPLPGHARSLPPTPTRAQQKKKATLWSPYLFPARPNTGTHWKLKGNRGDEGNRTPVLRDLSCSSPSAACFAFLSPGDHAGKTPTGSVTV